MVDVCVPFDFPIQYARELFIFTIALSYSSLNPLVLPCATVYLALAFLTAKYNFMYVLPNPYQGRKMTPLVIDRIIFSVFLYQGLMLGVFTSKIFPTGSISCALLLIITGIFRWFMTSAYYRSTKYLPLKDCPKKSKDAQSLTAQVREMYLNPAFKPLVAEDGTSLELVTVEDSIIDENNENKVISRAGKANPKTLMGPPAPLQKVTSNGSISININSIGRTSRDGRHNSYGASRTSPRGEPKNSFDRQRTTSANKDSSSTLHLSTNNNNNNNSPSTTALPPLIDSSSGSGGLATVGTLSHSPPATRDQPAFELPIRKKNEDKVSLLHDTNDDDDEDGLR